ncbi:hypothetical protein SAMN00120144_1499 [Hymenobacter roseosalivarius DSM 11622]|uniref:Uncharacterized protein n=1 Tax=Hymenobacter roseosalivarius DSM 11622 TaxID=645990 RepID=A0A1W1V1F3_9BACT|nr:hypothetical protein [Hymenobacter roseosalivarius]SMB87187.1 hypothetical protein SAMN00120144_1499 [Hymenobacter roseosalivarius DSM 11622]
MSLLLPTSSSVSIGPPATARIRRWVSRGRLLLVRYRRSSPVVAAAPLLSAGAGWAGRLRQGLGVAFILGFVLLTWVRAESLARMMPHLLDLLLGALAGLIGSSLGHWFRLLGVRPASACTASHTLKLIQIVGVPLGYVLLGGNMLLLPVLGASLAAALVLVGRQLGWSCGARGGAAADPPRDRSDGDLCRPAVLPFQCARALNDGNIDL